MIGGGDGDGRSERGGQLRAMAVAIMAVEVAVADLGMEGSGGR